MAIIIFDDIFLEHNTGNGHPENAQRLLNTREYLKSKGYWNDNNIQKPEKCSIEEITSVHNKEYVKKIELMCEKGSSMLDADTRLSAKSYEAAIYACGAATTAVDKIMEKSCKSAFCLVRPPGHHATPQTGMGFCLFNNAAISARYIQSKYKLDRILIIDWDVHHGNGTQDAFYDDPSVLYFSMHRFPFYPGTGSKNEKGNGNGLNYTVNVPLDAYTETDEYFAQFKEVINGQAKEFNPQFIIISAGFDAYINDPIGGLGLEIKDFTNLTEIVVQLAEECCEGRIVSCLEGGYHLADLPKCIEAHLNALS